MASGGFFGADQVRHFNGDLFSTVDTVIFSPLAMLQLHEATKKDWRNIEPSIFGTLFERALDASKRSQLGAHYTGAADIDLVVQPVVMDPYAASGTPVARGRGPGRRRQRDRRPRPPPRLPGPPGLSEGARPPPAAAVISSTPPSAPFLTSKRRSSTSTT